MFFAGNTEAFCQSLNALIFFLFQAKVISTPFCLFRSRKCFLHGFYF